MKNVINADNRLIPAGGFVAKPRSSQRRKLLDAFASFRNDAGEDSILDVGIMPIPLFDTRECLAAWIAPRYRSRITSYKIAPPGSAPSRFRPQGPGGTRTLPYRDGQFDWVFRGETLEHAGNYEQQYALVRELARVARKGVFITTSTRRHPIEFNNCAAGHLAAMGTDMVRAGRMGVGVGAQSAGFTRALQNGERIARTTQERRRTQAGVRAEGAFLFDDREGTSG